jgi:hypothetical protein
MARQMAAMLLFGAIFQKFLIVVIAPRPVFSQ